MPVKSVMIKIDFFENPMMKIRVFIWSSVFLILVAGCTSFSRTPDRSSIPAETASPIQTLPGIPTSASLSQPTVLVTSSQSPVPFSTRNATSPPATLIQQKCLEMMPTLAKDNIHAGVLVFLGDHVFQKDGNSYHARVPFYDLQTGQTQFFPHYKIKNIVISPDHKKYALQDMNDHQISVFSAAGQLLAAVPPKEDPWFLGEWLDNEHLVLAITKPVEGTLGYVVYPQEIIIANPFTGDQKYFSSDYPDIDKQQLIMMWEGGGTTKYDPTLSQVVYASTIQHDYQGNSEQGYVLWDLMNQTKLVEVATGDFALTPKWSPDGSNFIFNNFSDGEFYTITRDGVVAQVTNLNAHSGTVKYFSDIYSWSPDGRYLAFWLESVKNQTITGTFSILDMSSGLVTEYCISSGNGGGSAFPPIYTPIWSPDGKSLAVIGNRDDDGSYDTILVDLEREVASKIGEKLFPVGWLDTNNQ